VTGRASSTPLGPVLLEQERAWLKRPAVGGVVLFTRNYESPKQLRRLVADLHDIRHPRLLVCIDQEGGRVQRLKQGFTRLPPLGGLGRLYREDPLHAGDMAYRHARVMATEMLAYGIDMSFAPVLDLDRGSHVIGDRSFGQDPQTVTELGRAYLAGMHDAGMKTTGKHFPGHGSVVADSHVADVTDGRSLEAIRAADLQPFTALKDSLDALMVAHVTYPDVDERPAGYSRRWLADILRGELAYRGVVISDDLGMHAAHHAGRLIHRVSACIEAGCDLALVCMEQDVIDLMASEPAAPSDVSELIGHLYGRPTVDADELEQVVIEGIREWPHWQKSLEQMT
jgi:beta-N-acetylhexosaminidase